MSDAPTLAVVAARRMDAGTLEFLRLGTGLVAGGGALTLVEVGRGAGLLSGGADLPEDAERYLEGLASFGTVPHPVDAGALRDLLTTCDRFLRVADADRSGAPPLVIVDAAWLAATSDDALVRAFEDAGQIIGG